MWELNYPLGPQLKEQVWESQEEMKKKEEFGRRQQPGKLHRLSYSNMWLFISLPLSVWHNVLSCMCSIEELAKFDTAMCNRKGRKYFFEELCQKPTFILDQTICQMESLYWLSTRKLKMKLLNLGPSDFKNKTKRFELNTEKVENLEMRSSLTAVVSKNNLAAFITACPSLKILTLYDMNNFTAKVIQQIKKSVLAQLTSLTIINSVQFNKALSQIAISCHLLTSLSLKSSSIDFSVVGDVLKGNKSMKLLEIIPSRDDQLICFLLQKIEKFGLQLQTINITSGSEAEGDSIVAILTNCKELKTLKLNRKHSYSCDFYFLFDSTSNGNRIDCITMKNKDINTIFADISGIVDISAITLSQINRFSDSLQSSTIQTIVSTTYSTLTFLSIKDCWSYFNAQDVRPLLTGANSVLRSLVVYDTYLNDDSQYNDLFTTVTNNSLTTLCACLQSEKLEPSFLQLIFKSLTALKKLYIYCRGEDRNEEFVPGKEIAELLKEYNHVQVSFISGQSDIADL